MVRAAGLLAGHAHEPALPLHDDVERWPIRVRAVETPPRDRDVHEVRVGLHERRGREPEIGHRPGPQVLHDDVRGLRQLSEDLLTLLALQIDRDAALVAIEAGEVAALAVDERLEEPGEVAAARMLDLDDFRAEIGELHPAERTRHVVPDLDDARASERWLR